MSAHCEVWAGFIFVNVADEPEQSLREFLGPMVTNLEGYPFDQMTSRFAYRTTIEANWKLFMDAFQEFYHAPIVHAGQSPDAYANAARQAGFEAPHYRIEARTGSSAPRASGSGRLPDEMVKPMEPITRGGLFGPWDAAELGECPAGGQPGAVRPVGARLVPALPELRDPDLEPGLVPHVPLLADVPQHPCVRGQRLLHAAAERRGSASRRRWPR